MPEISRRWRVLALLAVLALVAAACGGDGDDGADAADGTADGTADTDTDGDVEDVSDDVEEGGTALQLAGWASSDAENRRLQEVADAYNEQSPNAVALNFLPEYDTTLQTAIAGGQPPDVFYVDANRLPDLVEAGVLDDAEGRIDDPDDFIDSIRDAFTYGGTFYCPPKDYSTLALQYNVDLFDDAGVEPPTTWEELREAAQALTDDDTVGLVIGTEYPRWGAFMLQAGGGLTDEDVTEMTLDTPENREAFEFLEQLFHDGYAATAAELDAGWPGEAFGLERAAMTVEGNWIVPALRNDYPDVNWGVAELPVGPAGPGTLAFTVCYAVPADAADPEASWDLVDYLVSTDVMLDNTIDFPVLPSRESAAQGWLDANDELTPFVESAEYARPFQFVPGFADVLDALNDGIQGIAAGNRTIDEVFAQVQPAGEAALE
jgi:multiple sugar transport system substrate-binding protein